MGNFSWSDLLGGGIGSAVGGLFNWLEGDSNRKHQAEMQKNQNEWQKQENQDARNWQSEEALKAREWQEDFYEQYQSPEAQIASQMAGYKANGINPALMFGGSAPSGGSVPSSSAPSAANGSPGMVHSPQMDLGAMVQNFAAGVQITEQLFTAKDRFKEIEMDANIKEVNYEYQKLDYDDRKELKNQIREMKLWDYFKAKDELDISGERVIQSQQETELGRQAVEQGKYKTDLAFEEWKTKLSKNKKGETLLATELKADVLNKLRDADIKLDEHQLNDINEQIKAVERKIVDEDLSQEQSETAIKNFYKDHLQQYGVQPDANPFSFLLQSLHSVSSPDDLQASADFEKRCESIDPETGWDGWTVLLLIATTVIPYGRVAKAGTRIFGKLFPKVFEKFSSIRGTKTAQQLKGRLTSTKSIRKGIDKRGNPYSVETSNRYAKPD